MTFEVTHLFKTNGLLRMGRTIRVEAHSLDHAHTQVIELHEPNQRECLGCFAAHQGSVIYNDRHTCYRNLDAATVSNGVNAFYAEMSTT